jgi:7-cyano-7-deazaguanine synthase in queuosine biosynthesis
MEYAFINSGGKDSLAAAMVLTQAGHTLRSVYVSSGQRASVDAASRLMAATIAAKYAVDHRVVELGGNFLSPESKLGGLAYQNIFIHVMAASWAVSNLGIYEIASGTTKAADLQGLFKDRLQALFDTSAHRPPPNFTFPVYLAAWMTQMERGMYEIVKIDPMWRDTITCNFSYPGCGVCGHCVVRSFWLTLS